MMLITSPYGSKIYESFVLLIEEKIENQFSLSATVTSRTPKDSYLKE